MKRRVVSVAEVTAELEALARRYHIPAYCFDEAASEAMSEFDALAWGTLCAQRVALRQRESENVSSGWEVPSRLLFVYEANHCSVLTSLENTSDTLSELAA